MRIPLHDLHVASGARIVPFAGWDMPVQYSSIKEEHHAVRSACGLFDVSHMGEFRFRGQAGRDLLQFLTTNDLESLPVGACQYTFFLNENRGTVDDAMVYRLDVLDFLVVVNAGNIDKDWSHVEAVAADFPGAEVANESAEFALLAVQGPRAFETVGALVGQKLDDLAFHTLREIQIDNRPVLAAASGYTGENGLELFVSPGDVEGVWNRLSERPEVTPCGLGARDTLRLEASLALYGHELDDVTSPLEARLGFAVASEGDYLGSDWIAEQRAAGPERLLVMIEMVDRAIPRQGYEILSDKGAPIGHVTSGSLAPWLNKHIGMGYVEAGHAKVGRRVGIRIRDRVVEAVQVKRPFYKRPER